jgi:hypothetical protein
VQFLREIFVQFFEGDFVRIFAKLKVFCESKFLCKSEAASEVVVGNDVRQGAKCKVNCLNADMKYKLSVL